MNKNCILNKAYLLTGTNIGSRKENLNNAVLLIQRTAGTIVRRSAIYRTAAWGNHDQPDFFNQVLLIETVHTPQKLLKIILEAEIKLGRRRTVRNAPRIIDIDILFFNEDIVEEPGLHIPHPEIPNRKFVLAPLTEIADHYFHPILKKTVSEILIACKDPLPVSVIQD